jgi:hypothetical protein
MSARSQAERGSRNVAGRAVLDRPVPAGPVLPTAVGVLVAVAADGARGGWSLVETAEQAATASATGSPAATGSVRVLRVCVLTACVLTVRVLAVRVHTVAP